MMKAETASAQPNEAQTPSSDSASGDDTIDEISTKSEVSESVVAEADSAELVGADKLTRQSSRGLQVSVSVRSLLVAAVITVLVAAIGVLSWLYIGARHQLNEEAHQSETSKRAEKLALDYAVNAAAMNYEDLNAWKSRLVAGTSPELKDKLTKAATSMEQILVPLQWNSTASPLAAKVVSRTGGAIVVDSFVSVLTKTVQAPDPLRSTATYSVTIDSSNNWQISDVGGIGAAVDHQ